MTPAIPTRAHRPTLAPMDTTTAPRPDGLAATAQTASEDILCDHICNAWSGLISSVIDAGRYLIELKDQTDHGRWVQLIRERLPFSEDTAQKLIKIAAHPVLSNAEHARLLPSAWSQLAEIANVEPDTLKDALDNGLITPTMTRQDIRELSRRLRYEQSGGAPEPKLVPVNDEIPPEPTVADQIFTANAAAVIAASCGVAFPDVMSETRGGPRAALARHLLAYTLRVEYDWTTVRVGGVMNRDRTTVSHSCEVITDIREEHYPVDEWIVSLKSAIAHMQTLHHERPAQLRIEEAA